MGSTDPLLSREDSAASVKPMSESTSSKFSSTVAVNGESHRHSATQTTHSISDHHICHHESCSSTSSQHQFTTSNVGNSTMADEIADVNNSEPMNCDTIGNEQQQDDGEIDDEYDCNSHLIEWIFEDTDASGTYFEYDSQSPPEIIEAISVQTTGSRDHQSQGLMKKWLKSRPRLTVNAQRFNKMHAEKSTPSGKHRRINLSKYSRNNNTEIDSSSNVCLDRRPSTDTSNDAGPSSESRVDCRPMPEQFPADYRRENEKPMCDEKRTAGESDSKSSKLKASQSVASVASSLNSDPNAPMCKICHLNGKDMDPLITPCKCAGTMRFIHCGCLMKWLEISNKRTRKPLSCELCQYQYHWHKKFKVRHWQFPNCSRKDKILHTFFFLSVLTMITSAVLIIMSIKHDRQQPKTTEINRHELTFSEVITLICGALFFIGFFIAMYVEVRARNTLYSLILKFIYLNQQWYIDEYEKKDSTRPVEI